MANRKQKIVLFLGTDADLLSRAEAAFLTICNRMGIPWGAERRILDASIGEGGDWFVCLDPANRPLLEQAHPDWSDRVEYWPAGTATLEAEATDLAARLISGGRKREDKPAVFVPPSPAVTSTSKTTPPGVAPVVRVGRETKGRRGKGVTIVYDVPEDEAGLLALAAKLKQRVGTGGTVRDGTIEIQGDQRDRLTTELQALGYRVKRTGG